MKIKVCGMTNIDQMHQLGEMGVEFAGLIFYPNSPRYVMKHGLRGRDLKKEKIKPYKVGVFVDASYEQVMEQVDEYGLDMVQLHGRETPYECSRIANYIHVIKAFRFMENDHVMWMLKDFYGDADMFLFDTGIPVQGGEKEAAVYGGTGRKCNWNRLKGLDIGKPFFLSGGIDPTDAGTVRDFQKDPVAKDLFVVDINSRFETSPGVKDMVKVKQFLNELKNGHEQS